MNSVIGMVRDDDSIDTPLDPVAGNGQEHPRQHFFPEGGSLPARPAGAGGILDALQDATIREGRTQSIDRVVTVVVAVFCALVVTEDAVEFPFLAQTGCEMAWGGPDVGRQTGSSPRASGPSSHTCPAVKMSSVGAGRADRRLYSHTNRGAATTREAKSNRDETIAPRAGSASRGTDARESRRHRAAGRPGRVEREERTRRRAIPPRRMCGKCPPSSRPVGGSSGYPRHAP